MENKARTPGADVVARNSTILENFGRALASQDEERFITAGSKLDGWIKNSRAYYREARPKIVELLETAGKTLATLSGLPPGVPFSIHSDFSPTLHKRRMVYIDLTKTLFANITRFHEDGDIYRRACVLTGLSTDLDATKKPMQSTTSSAASGSASKLVSTTATTKPIATTTSSQPIVQKQAQLSPSPNDPMHPPIQVPVENLNAGKTGAPLTSAALASPGVATPSSKKPPTLLQSKKPVLTTRRLSSSPVVSSPLATSFVSTSFPSPVTHGFPMAQSPTGSAAGLPPSLSRRQVSPISSRSGATASPANSMLPPSTTPLSAIGRGGSKAGESSAVSAQPALPTPPPTASSETNSVKSTASALSNPDQANARPKKKPKLANVKSGLPATNRGYLPWELVDLNWYQNQKKGTEGSASMKGPDIPGVNLSEQGPSSSRSVSTENAQIKSSPSTPTVSLPEPPLTIATLGHNNESEQAVTQGQDVEMQDATVTPGIVDQSAVHDAASVNSNAVEGVDVQKNANTPEMGEEIQSAPLAARENAADNIQEAVVSVKPEDMQLDADTQAADNTAESEATEEEVDELAESSASDLSISRSPSTAFRNLDLNESNNALDPDLASLVSYDVGRMAGEETIFEFEVSDIQEISLNDWKTRIEHQRNMQHATCYSLACYSKEDFGDVTIDEANPAELRRTFLSLTPKWPINARLQAFIGPIRTFLAPPLVLTGENFVDISSHVKEKNAIVKLDYQADYSDYLFALYCHPPTASQLRELEERRAKEKNWQDFLTDMKRPFTMDELFGDLLTKL